MKQKSFTIIELLVVIAIIGLLSSVVLVNLKGTREKARLAKAKDFSAQVHHALGDQAVGIWRFEQGSGNTAKDSSGYGNDGTVSDPVNMWQTAAQCGLELGGCLEFDGTGDYVDIPYSGFPTMSSVTVSSWVKLSDTSSNKHMVTRYGSTGIQFSLYHGGGNLTFFINGGGGTNWIGSSNNALKDGAWHHVVGVFDGSTKNHEIFVDGVSVGQRTYNVVLNNPATSVMIGDSNFHLAAEVFDGLIDEVAIYSTALTSTQIQKLYAQGLEKHKLVQQ